MKSKTNVQATKPVSTLRDLKPRSNPKGGAPSGKVVIKDIPITKQVDVSSP